MQYTDYYAIMNVSKTATQADIKKAFRKLALQYHPDKNAGNKAAEEQFKKISEANEVLSSPEKRKKYDELGENWNQHEQHAQQQQRQQKQYANQSGNERGNESYFSDFFDQFFASDSNSNGGQGFSSNSNRGSDYETEMNITLEEAFQGTHRIIQLEQEKLRVTTKPGTSNDQRLRIKGKGAFGQGNSNRGDLFVHIKITPNPLFLRKGNDLHSTQLIDLCAAVLGGEVLIKTLLGQLKINIAAGTQSGKTIRLKGKGMPVYERPTEFGNLYVELNVHTPEHLSTEQKEMFEAYKLSLVAE